MIEYNIIQEFLAEPMSVERRKWLFNLLNISYKREMVELRDLYDNNNNLTGEKCIKGEHIPDDKYIKVVTLFLYNNNDQILLQKRSKEKGGKYGLISGHPKTGETSTQGMVKEVKEEMGIDINDKEIELFHTEKTKHQLFDFFYMKKDLDLSNSVLQKEEVDDIQWFSMDQVDQLIKNEEFFENHVEAMDIIKEYKKENNV